MPIWHAKANRRMWKKKTTSFGKSLTKPCLCYCWKIVQDRLLAVRPHTRTHSLPHAWILVHLETGGGCIQPWACILASAVLCDVPRQSRLLLLGTDQTAPRNVLTQWLVMGLSPCFICAVDSLPERAWWSSQHVSLRQVLLKDWCSARRPHPLCLLFVSPELLVSP